MPFRPGTDALALLAMLHVVFAERSVALKHLGEGARGLDRLRAVAAQFPPSRVEAATGVPAQTLRAAGAPASGVPVRRRVELGPDEYTHLTSLASMLRSVLLANSRRCA